MATVVARGQITIGSISDGVGIRSSSVMYARGNSYGTAPTSGWQASVPQLTTAYPYLWTRTVLTFTDGTTQTAYSVSYKGEKGDKGDTGEKGDKGDTGAQGDKGEKGDKGDTGAQGDKGAKGDKGDAGSDGSDGADAVTLVAEPSAVTFSTDANGSLKSASSQRVLLTYTRGKQTAQTDLTIASVTSVGFDTVPTYVGRAVTINPTDISVTAVSVDGSTKALPYTQAQVTVTAVVDSVGYTVVIPVSVNVSAYWGGLETSLSGLKSEYSSLGTKVGTLDTEYAEIEKRTSAIEETSEKISMQVYEPVAVRSNLLAGSAFRRQGDGGFDWSTPYAVVKNDGYGGVNAVRLCPSQSGVAKSISYGAAVTKVGTRYTLSMLLKSTSAGATLSIVAGANTYAVTISAKNTWTAWSKTFEATAAQTAISVKPTQSSYDINVCRMMLCAGSYGGWTMSESDTAYVGGNLIDNAGTLTVSGNLTGRGDRSETGDGDGTYKATRTAAAGAGAQTLLRVALTGMEKSQDYILSFYARRTAWSGGNIICSWSGGVALAEMSNGMTVTAAEGSVSAVPSEDWQRHWYHIRTRSDASSSLSMYVYAYNGITAELKKPKLEKGATVTDWTAASTDMIEDVSMRDRLQATGIDITAQEITLTAAKTKVQLNDGTEVAVFDQSGLNADLITADKLSTSGADAHVEIANGLIEIFGKACCNIRFGVNADGYAVLSYYDNEGKWLYDLGPNKLDSSNNQGAGLTAYSYVDMLTIAGASSGTALTSSQTFIAGDDNLTADVILTAYSAKFFGERMYASDNEEVDERGSSHKGFCPGKSKAAESIYQYRAGKLSNAYLTDTARGLTTAALAKAADGKWFTSGSVLAKSGSLTNLASGDFVLQSDTVGVAVHPDASALDDGASYKWPAYSLRVAHFTGGIREVDKIYSDIIYTYSVGSAASAASLDDGEDDGVADENAAVD